MTGLCVACLRSFVPSWQWKLLIQHLYVTGSRVDPLGRDTPGVDVRAFYARKSSRHASHLKFGISKKGELDNPYNKCKCVHYATFRLFCVSFEPSYGASAYSNGYSLALHLALALFLTGFREFVV